MAPALDDAAWLAALAATAANAAAPPAPLPPSLSPGGAAAARLAAAYGAFRAEFDRGYGARLAEASAAELRKLGIVAAR